MIDLIEALGTCLYDRKIFHREETPEEEPTTINTTTMITTTLKEILSPLYNWRMS